ncbi:MAG: nicotinate phosphoribosyltransferase, partial [Acidobacteria bacterium]|nr:nicotinate phosphoribosyltransferase [Acidobacteriota bacterium]
MMQAYFVYGMEAAATFDLFVRRLPRRRSFLVAAGAGTVVELLEKLHFTGDQLDYLESTGLFRQEFLDSLESFRFRGDVDGLPEGTVTHPPEPILRITAPLPQAQLVETLVMNQVHLQTMLASKAARVLLAARGRRVVDFGLRRMHGADAGLAGARAFHIAGLDATSNVLAGKTFGIPVTGTMAHSFIQAHDDEAEALERFTRVYPETVLLVDTYDTLAGIDKVVALAGKLGKRCRLRG